MLFSIFNVISNILLLVIFLFFKKSNEKQNLVKWIIISFGILFCYNAIVSYVLSLIGVPIYLLSFIICNILLSLVMLFFIKKNGYQKYYILKKDIIIVILFTVIVILLGVLRFGILFNIVYETSDPGVHFWTAKDFYEQSYLLDRVTDKTVVNFETRQFASYVNLGLIFKVIAPFIHEIDFYKVYILFDLGMLLLSTLIFYVLIDNEKKKVGVVITILGILLYMLGYPLNNMIIGFFYLGHSIMVISLILILYRMYMSNLLNRKVCLILLFMANLGLFFTYYFFVPVVFGSLFVYFIYTLLKNKKKIFTINNFIFILVMYILPCIIGIIYFIVPNIGNSDQSVVYQISLDGLCYIDLINSFLLFIPIILCYIINRFKTKNINFEIFMYISLWLFIILLMVLVLNDVASVYYLSKPYYLLWLLTFIITFKAIEEVNTSKKVELNGYLVFIVVCAILSVSGLQEKFHSLTENHSENNYYNIFEIYNYNLKHYNEPKVILTADKMNDLKKVYSDNLDNLYYNATSLARVWLVAYFEKEKINFPENQLYTYILNNYYINSNNLSTFSGDNAIIFKSLLFDGYNNDSSIYDKYKNMLNGYDFIDYDSFLLIKRR